MIDGRRRTCRTARRSRCWAIRSGRSRYGGDPAVIGRHADDQRRAGRGRRRHAAKASACRPTSTTKRRSRRSCGGRCRSTRLTAERGSHGYYGAAVLAPGADRGDRDRRAARAHQRLTEQGLYPAAMQFSAFRDRPLDEEIRGGIRPAMWLLMGAVGVPAADRLRERREPAAGARRRAAARDGGAHGDRRRARSPGATAADRKRRAGAVRRGARPRPGRRRPARADDGRSHQPAAARAACALDWHGRGVHAGARRGHDDRVRPACRRCARCG